MSNIAAKSLGYTLGAPTCIISWVCNITVWNTDNYHHSAIRTVGKINGNSEGDITICYIHLVVSRKVRISTSRTPLSEAQQIASIEQDNISTCETWRHRSPESRKHVSCMVFDSKEDSSFMRIQNLSGLAPDWKPWVYTGWQQICCQDSSRPPLFNWLRHT